MEMSKKFIVLTTGRAGSTAFMDALEKFDDIALPNKNIDCRDNELLNPYRVEKNYLKYQELCNTSVSSQEDIIECFFDYNSRSAYAGFKTMPERHIPFGEFITKKDIRFIILTRLDICSTIASFFVAANIGSWRRSGEPQTIKWRFEKKNINHIFEYLGYIYKSNKLLDQVENGLRITYEDICSPDFNNKELNDFFGRKIKLENPKSPVTAADYVVNWEEFKEFVEESYQRLHVLVTQREG